MLIAGLSYRFLLRSLTPSHRYRTSSIYRPPFHPPPRPPSARFRSTIDSQGHTLLTRLSGAQPSVLSAALTSHATKPSALSSSSAVPTTASGTYAPAAEEDDDEDEEEENEEELEKRCEELMKQSSVVLFMKGDRGTPRWVSWLGAQFGAR